MTETLARVQADAEVIAQLADEANSREVVDLVADRLVALVTAPGQQISLYDLEKYEAEPVRKQGTVTLTDADSFVAYIERHKDAAATTIWANIEQARVVAVFDDHQQASTHAGWGMHRAVLQLKHTPDWKHWTKADGCWLNQEDFAEHIEGGIDSIRVPDPVTMLEVAQTFHAKRGVSFTSTKMLSGEVEFSYDEQTTAKAGHKGSIDVPATFTLGIPPFEGNEPWELTARLRFKLVGDGGLQLGYKLIRPDRVLRAAFDAIASDVNTGADLPVMSGVPRQA